MFGRYYVPNKLELDFRHAKVLFERLNGELVRLVVVSRNTVSRKLLQLNEKTPVDVKPSPPIGGSLSVDCLYFIFDEPIVLAPFTKLNIVVRIPVDAGLYVNEKFIMVVPLGRVKYALYGVPDMGDICRYVEPDIINSYATVAKAQVKITSNSDNTIEVKKVIIPLKNATLVYTSKGELFFSDISLNIVAQNRIEVQTHDTSSIVEDIPVIEVKGMGSTYVMKYGV